MRGLLQGESLRSRSLILAGGTVFGQLLGAIAAPILTRLYSAEDLGHLAVYVSIVTIVGGVSTLKYDMAVVLPDNDEQASRLLLTALISVGMTVLVASLLLLASHGAVLALLGADVLSRYWWLVPLGVGVVGLVQALAMWSLRVRDYRQIARSRIAQGGTMTVAQIAGGVAGFGPVGLAAGHLLGMASAAAALAGSLRGAVCNRSLRRGLLDDMKRYRKFPLFSAPSGLMNALSSQTPVLLLSALFNASAAGMYSLGQRVIQTPMNVVSQAVAQAFLSEAPESCRQDRLPLLVAGTLRRLVRVGLPPILAVALFAPAAFGLIFGSSWAEAGTYAQVLAPWLLAVFVGSPLSTIGSVLEKQKGDYIFNATLLVARVGAFYFFAGFASPYTSVVVFGVVSFLWWVGYICWLLRIGGVTMASIAPVFKECLPAIGVVIALYVIYLPLQGDAAACLAVVGIAAGVLMGASGTRSSGKIPRRASSGS